MSRFKKANKTDQQIKPKGKGENVEGSPLYRLKRVVKKKKKKLPIVSKIASLYGARTPKSWLLGILGLDGGEPS